MKILVLSDSHRTMRYMEEALEIEKPDHVIHLGDHSADAEELSRRYPMLPILSVRGNCDWDCGDRDEVLADLQGVRFLVCHGHQYGVKSGLLRYTLAAREKLAQVALFGHTHQPVCTQMHDIWFVNPGSCGGYRPSYAVIKLNNGLISCQLKNVD